MSRDRSHDPPKTAAELLAELARDPAHVAMRERAERERREAEAVNRRDEAPVVAELRAAGIGVGSTSDLVAGRVPAAKHRDAVPILLRWLPRITNPDVKRSIVRSLSVPMARPAAAPALLDEFDRADDPGGEGLRSVVASALAVVAGDESFDAIVERVRDPRNGGSRAPLALALGNMRERAADAVAVLRSLLDDPTVAPQAVTALGELRAVEARPEVERFLDHPDAMVRKEARKALSKLATRARRRG